MGACEKIKQNCQLIHGNKRFLEPKVFRFFKVMFGSDFNEALFFPPKFGKMVEDLVGQETQLEDSRGICWTVKLEHYKGQLAFQRGWYEFSVDHDLNIGDFLVFSYQKGGHFVVHAFGKDACEKLNSARTHPTPIQRARSGGNIATENIPNQTTCNYARNGKSTRTSVEIQQKNNELCLIDDEKKDKLCMDYELYLMVDRDATRFKSDCSSCLHDLSIFEMQQNVWSEGSIRKISAQSDEVDLKVTNRSNVAIQHPSLKRNNCNLSKRPKKTSRNLEREPATKREGGNSFAATKTNEGVKTGLVDSLDLLSTDQISFSCQAASEGSHCIELPHCIPTVKFPCNQGGRTTLVLEDPKGREWGSIYHQRSGLYILVSSWDKINAENGIQPGDCLVFSVTDASLSKYKFDIVREGLGH